MNIIKQNTIKLTTLVGEKYIAEEIFNMKYAMEHKESMDKICNIFKDMSCVVLNTVSEETIDNAPIQTHLIFHDKMDSDIIMGEEIEQYVFAYQLDEIEQLDYINNIISNKGDLFLNSEEYMGIYDITSFEESNL